ncbi:hypothetical protein EV192_108160 [Actinocrispum wychmicini]|uniref:Secreted protein n=2 Tax=Actinocrispum wychmicini TaxID=1213861 RepID=A0A4R2JAI8_9PSEU|nr:hypothetical protein EV192_108160 [Actinocrispum wychmicini]
MSAMPGHQAMPAGDGLADHADGFRFVPTATVLGSEFRFRIEDAGGRAVTLFEPDQTKLMHFYLIRSDLSGFQHVHPTMAADGTWSAPLAETQPGEYRAYASFIAGGKTAPLVLSQKVTAPGTGTTTPLPPAATTTQVDGYTVTLGGGQLMAGMSRELTVTITRDGKPVDNLQPYLDTYAHLTAFHEGDQAFTHLHPANGPALSFEAKLPKAGQWRLFIQFQTDGTLHTAAVTIAVG